jgi:hypothetical protein
MTHHIHAGILVAAMMATRLAGAQELSAEASIGTEWTDNVHLMHTGLADSSIVPSLRAGLDFANCWTVEYDGAAELFVEHTDLSSHNHTLRLVANPAWGADDENEFLAALAVETLRNQDTYAALNFAGVKATAALTLEPAAWLAWQLGLDLRYRRFYDDTESDSVDTMPRASARFTLPSRTTLSPRVGYGFRYSPGLRGRGLGRPDRRDQQAEAGVHVSQGLWESAGLQADYSYRHLFAASGVLPHKLTQAQFAFLTTDFLAGGHRTYLKYRQVLPAGWSATAGVEYRILAYKGWPAADAQGNLTGADRVDRRLSPSASVRYSRETGGLGLDAAIEYSYVRQWSNSADYDAHAQVVSLELGMQY